MYVWMCVCVCVPQLCQRFPEMMDKLLADIDIESNVLIKAPMDLMQVQLCVSISI